MKMNKNEVTVLGPLMIHYHWSLKDEELRKTEKKIELNYLDY